MEIQQYLKIQIKNAWKPLTGTSTGESRSRLYLSPSINENTTL